ncbi:MAG: response regulator [Burkholderiaceae bacterium]|jgi:serine/threonine-protein kinase|nr:response regulator [Burkholderiaceae bacterium]
MANVNQNRATILFVDDEDRITALLSMMFRVEYNVLTANSGQQALDLISRQRVDVLVSDQRMPGMTGVELLRQVRDIAPNTMRLLLTGYSDLSAIVGSVNEGEVFRFLNKPWDNHEIRQTVADAVAAARASRTGPAVKPPPAPAPAMQEEQLAIEQQVEVLLIDDNPAGLKAMNEVLAGRHKIRSAASLDQALMTLERRDIGVIVTDARTGETDMLGFLRAVKKNYPAITTVMLTRSVDADHVIQLINRAQIFRFATKPMRRSVFQLAVQGAVKEHLRLKANPYLVVRYQVERRPSSEDASPLARAVARSLTRLKALFGFKRAAR